jgi:hypothetical protein
MTILYDSTRPVKPSTFACGILRSAPVDHLDMTQADREWWTAVSNGRDADLDRHVDAIFAEAEAIARLEMGLCC